MLTEWGKKALNVSTSSITGYTSGFGNTGVEGLIKAKRSDGEEFYICAWPAYSQLQILTSVRATGGDSGYVVGSGNKAESDQDYALDNMLTNISGTCSFATVTSVDGSYYGYRARLTITNISQEEITIREVGKFCGFARVSNKGDIVSNVSNARSSFLIDRTLLSTPVTIPAGESRVVDYIMAFNV